MQHDIYTCSFHCINTGRVPEIFDLLGLHVLGETGASSASGHVRHVAIFNM